MADKQFPIRIPEEMRREIKVLCAQRGISMKRFFEEAAEQHLKKCNAELDTTPDQR